MSTGDETIPPVNERRSPDGEHRWPPGIAVLLAILMYALLSDPLLVDPRWVVPVLGGLQVWLTNIIVFGLAYWEIDRGGPITRTQRSRDDLPDADFRFPHDENVANVREVAVTSSAASGWVPHFIDYLYVSVTNSSAFSPTDTMPLSTRAKCLMGFQSLTAFVISVLVIARAVSLVGG